MEVYFDTNYWGHPADQEPMREVRLDYMFQWEELSGFIPAVYVSEEGIAVDFCVKIQDDAVAAFYEKWQALAKEELTEEIQERTLRENPLAFDFSAELFVDGKRLEHAYGCGASYSRVISGREAAVGSLEEELVRAYGCDPDASWCFRRQIYRWEMEPERLECLNLMLIAEKKEYFCEEITVTLDDAGKQYRLVHPLTGKAYGLSVIEVRQEGLPLDMLPRVEKELPLDMLPRVEEIREQVNWPGYYMMFTYDMTPEISEENFRLRTKSGGDKPHSFISSDGRHGVAAVSIIGGADGPTSVFIAGKTEVERTGRIAMSPLYFEPVGRASWTPVFLEKERQDLEISINID